MIPKPKPPARGDPEAESIGRKDSDRYYQLPQWPIGSGVLFTLTLNENKLYLFFVSKADRYTRKTPRYSASTLAGRCCMDRKRLKDALLSLAARGLVQPFPEGKSIQVAVLFDAPSGLDYAPKRRLPTATKAGNNGVTDRPLNNYPLNAEVLNCRFPSGEWDNLSQNLGHEAPENGASCPSQWGAVPDWVATEGGGYEA